LLDGTAVLEGGTVHVVVGTPYVITINASDDGIKDPLTYSATIDGIPVGTVAFNVITVIPPVVGTFEVYVHVKDGCTTTPWGPITATFTQDCYTLTVNTVGSGSVTRTPDLSCYLSGSAVGLDPQAAPGWTFTGWSGDLGGSSDPESITMNSNKTVTATFDLACEYLVSTSFQLTWYAVDASDNGKIKYTTNKMPVLNSPTFNGTLIRQSHSAGQITVGVNLTDPYHIGSGTLIVTLEAVPNQVQTQGIFDVKVLLNGVLFVTVPFDAQGTAGDSFEIAFVPLNTVMTNNCGESMVIDVTDVATVQVIN
jgi:uncharacterized repeat protein (TIGR02543 family)